MSLEKYTIKELIHQPNMRFLLYGGKGGVGKTTCAIATALWTADNTDREILIISTDPAHSLSDSLVQDVSGGEVKPVKGVKNLFALEMSPKKEFEKYQASIQSGEIHVPEELKMFGDFTDFQSLSPPGSDETLAFSKVLEFIQTAEYDFFIFDTAPTGHTLRLLSLPEVLNSFFGKLLRFRMKMGQIWGKFKGLFSRGDDNEIDQLETLNHMKKVIENANEELSAPDRTSFIIVMIPELMAVYETERLIQTLYEYEIPVSNIIVNQIPPPPENNCSFCLQRRKMYLNNIKKIKELYTDDFNLIEIPLAPTEIRGIKQLRKFSHYLIV
ncbi:MAG: ArsA family ATPase [Candidatus Helarchaeota archaeon]